MTRMGFKSSTPEITNWVDMEEFEDVYSLGVSRTYYNQAVKKGLVFHEVASVGDKEIIYDLVKANRARMGRPIYMSFEDIQNTGKVLATDFFKVTNTANEIVAGAIMYQGHPEIAFAVFWGDTPEGRPLRAMDFLVLQLWSFYKAKGYKFIDLGISTETGVPNEGLLRFKETHECISSLRYSFSWSTTA
jgi:hypothetical protein